MLHRRAVAALAVVLLVGAAGCSDDPLTTPLAASPQPTGGAPSPEPSPSPSPVPSPTPLSPFENDPAVQGLRAYGAAAAEAVNARNLQLPALVAASTAARAAQNPDVFGGDLGSHFPGPIPFKVFNVATVDADTKKILICSVENGWGLTKPGGTPAKPVEILPIEVEMRLEGGVWKLHDGQISQAISCEGLTRESFA